MYAILNNGQILYQGSEGEMQEAFYALMVNNKAITKWDFENTLGYSYSTVSDKWLKRGNGKIFLVNLIDSFEA